MKSAYRFTLAVECRGNTYGYRYTAVPSRRWVFEIVTIRSQVVIDIVAQANTILRKAIIR